MTWLVVSVHDVAPASLDESRAWVEELDRLGVPASLLVVPGHWRGWTLRNHPPTVRWLHQRVDAGDEVVQHGWRHEGVPGGPAWRRVVDHVAARGCAEFWSLDEPEAADRLAWGGEVLERLGFDATGFTPPGWLASPGTYRALRRLGYRYTTSHVGLHDLGLGLTHRALALSHRPGGVGQRVGAAAMVRLAGRAARAGRPVRIALHPADRHHPVLIAATGDAVHAALAGGATPTTYGAVAA